MLRGRKARLQVHERLGRFRSQAIKAVGLVLIFLKHLSGLGHVVMRGSQKGSIKVVYKSFGRFGGIGVFRGHRSRKLAWRLST